MKVTVGDLKQCIREGLEGLITEVRPARGRVLPLPFDPKASPQFNAHRQEEAIREMLDGIVGPIVGPIWAITGFDWGRPNIEDTHAMRGGFSVSCFGDLRANDDPWTGSDVFDRIFDALVEKLGSAHLEHEGYQAGEGNPQDRSVTWRFKNLKLVLSFVCEAEDMRPQSPTHNPSDYDLLPWINVEFKLTHKGKGAWISVPRQRQTDLKSVHPSGTWWIDKNGEPKRPRMRGEAADDPPKPGWELVDADYFGKKL